MQIVNLAMDDEEDEEDEEDVPALVPAAAVDGGGVSNDGAGADANADEANEAAA